MSADTVYLYPKSSCPCEDCKDKYKEPSGIATNLSVRGCKVSPYFDCNDRVQLNESIQPAQKSGWVDLNPQVYTDKIARGFNPVLEPVDVNNSKQKGSCKYPNYISRDPRQWSSTRGSYLPLDNPPMNGDVKLKNIYEKKWDNYGCGFEPYKNIRDGQITYYYDKSIEDPYFSPLYGQKAEIHKVLYKDPMGAMKPEYNREWLSNTDNPTITTAKEYPYCLSYIQDTQSHREDMLAHQMRRRNQERWMPRWNFEN